MLINGYQFKVHSEDVGVHLPRAAENLTGIGITSSLELVDARLARVESLFKASDEITTDEITTDDKAYFQAGVIDLLVYLDALAQFKKASWETLMETNITPEMLRERMQRDFDNAELQTVTGYDMEKDPKLDFTDLVINLKVMVKKQIPEIKRLVDDLSTKITTLVTKIMTNASPELSDHLKREIKLDKYPEIANPVRELFLASK